MNTEPIHISGVAGPVVVTTNALPGRFVVTVGGRPATRVAKRRYALAAASGGTIHATIRSGLADPYPIVDAGGEKHRTGPTVPTILRVLAVLPIALAGIGGALGGLIGGLGVMANLTVARTRLPSAAKALIMIGVGVATYIVWSATAVAVRGAGGPS